jgi:hypothetical protein
VSAQEQGSVRSAGGRCDELLMTMALFVIGKCKRNVT